MRPNRPHIRPRPKGKGPKKQQNRLETSKLSKGQRKLVLELATKKKAREERGMFLIEGEKFVRDMQGLVEFSFTDRDVPDFRELSLTDAPQGVAAVARIPKFSWDDILSRKTIVVLDGVQDPGNVGTVIRTALGFDASVVLIESADPTNPKAVRSATGALLKTPWIQTDRASVERVAADTGRAIYRLELRDNAVPPQAIPPQEDILLIVGSEGRGIRMDIEGWSVAIPHNPELESLNVALAVGIVLYERTR